VGVTVEGIYMGEGRDETGHGLAHTTEKEAVQNKQGWAHSNSRNKELLILLPWKLSSIIFRSRLLRSQNPVLGI